MEPFEKDELSEAELDQILGEWNAPAAPARLRAALFPESRAPWWRRVWAFSIRVPLPVACALALLTAAGAWRAATPRVPQVVVKTQRVEVPVIQDRVITKYVYKKEPAARRAAVRGFDINGLKPVAELRPRIIRSGDAKN